METILKKGVKPIFVVWMLSILCYMSFIAKELTNSVDGLWASTYYQSTDWELSIGRWALLFLDKAKGGYAAEPFSSLLALLFLAIASYIVVRMFADANLKTIMYSLLIPCSITTCCFLAYRFTSSHYCLSVMVFVGAAWVVTRDIEEKKKSNQYTLIAIALMTFGLGIYQADLGCFCIPVMLYMMKLLMANENKKCLAVFVKSLIVGVASCIIYRVIWIIGLKALHITEASYNGADSVSLGAMIIGIPKSITLVYYSWIRFFGSSQYLFAPIRICIIIIVFALIITVGVMKLRNNLKNLMLYILLCLALPIGANIAVILAPSTKSINTQMTAPMMIVLPVLLLFLESIDLKRSMVIGILGALLLYGNIYAVGTDIDAISQGSKSSYAIMNNIVAKLNQENLLGKEYEYAFYGNLAKNELFKTNRLYDRANNYAKFGKLMTKTDMMQFAYKGLFDDIGLDLKSVDYDTYEKIQKSEQLEKMPSFPSEGAIIEEDGVVIVKVSDDYKWEK